MGNGAVEARSLVCHHPSALLLYGQLSQALGEETAGHFSLAAPLAQASKEKTTFRNELPATAF